MCEFLSEPFPFFLDFKVFPLNEDESSVSLFKEIVELFMTVSEFVYTFTLSLYV